MTLDTIIEYHKKAGYYLEKAIATSKKSTKSLDKIDGRAFEANLIFHQNIIKYLEAAKQTLEPVEP